MNDNTAQKIRTHNTVVGIITVATIGSVAGSVALGWEAWVPPLMVGGLIAAWAMHLTQYGSWTFRENYYLIFSMLLSFFHGIHYTSFFEIAVVSSVVMVNVTLFRRRKYVALVFGEFLVLMTCQVVMAIRLHTMEPDVLTLSKVFLHIIAEICIYMGLSVAISNIREDTDALDTAREEKEKLKTQTDIYLDNIAKDLLWHLSVVYETSADKVTPEAKDAMAHMTRQIMDVQDFSAIRRNAMELREERYRIVELMGDVIKGYRDWEKKKDPDLIVDLDARVPAALIGDSEKLKKLLIHLLDNAARYTDHGCVYLYVNAIRREYGTNLIFEVTDTGRGMSKKQVKTITSGIVSSHQEEISGTESLGLGFPIVYGIVRLMNGFVNIESQEGKGTTVRVSIAQKIADATPCLLVENPRFLKVAICLDPEKYREAQWVEFYKRVAEHVAMGLRQNICFAASIPELKKLMERGDITHVFTAVEEYEQETAYFDALSQGSVIVAVSSARKVAVAEGSRVIVMPKPLFSADAVSLLSAEEPAVCGKEAGHEGD